MRRPGARVFALLGTTLAALALLAVLGASSARSAAEERAAGPASNGSCVVCHGGIEDMHPFAPVTCVQCHGGDASRTVKEDAHVRSRTRPPGDERVLGQSFDPEYLRFLDPGDLRAAPASCGPCHQRAVYDVTHSLHATTSGHLADGLYENGVVAERHPPVAVFDVRDELPADVARPPTAVRNLKQVRGPTGGDRTRVASHFADLPRKACMQCHLWSRGRAVRGRAGLDGDYRGSGCSACHVPYADDGFSQSRDASIDHHEPGHARTHTMVRFPATETCTRCHYGDASIGLSFRGLAQPIPGMPQSPDAPGLHPKRLNGVYYIDDPARTPPDVHHARGMHCVDCHTAGDVMGDGFLYRRMEDAVAIRCETCHGTWDAAATGVTARGERLPHLTRDAGGVWLTSRVTGARHRVKQVGDIVRPGAPDYNPRAALAMSPDHGRLECYACHNAWMPNFFGFHFDRNEAFTQLDLLSGDRTTGRVTTQEKVFATFDRLVLGWNSHGRVAPYMVGFSSMATVHAEDGTLLLDQELPVTRAGLSGMTLVHHQPHTVTARARRCAECHASATTYGRGSGDFRLAREFVVTGGDTGARFVALDRETPADSALVSAAGIDEVRAVALVNDRLTGRAKTLISASASGELTFVAADVPGFPRTVRTEKDAVADPQALLVADDTLFVADGEAGLRIYDIANVSRPRLLAHVPDLPAYDVAQDGPLLFVAAGARGLVTLDVRDPREPVQVGGDVDVNGADTAPADARCVASLFLFSRPNATEPEKDRSAPRRLVAVGTAASGAWLLDATDAARPELLAPVGSGPVVDLTFTTLVELGSEGGAIPTRERHLLLGTNGILLVTVDVDGLQAGRPPRALGVQPLRPGARTLRVAQVYNPPFLRTLVLAAGAAGIEILDLAKAAEPESLGVVAGTAGALDLALEEFPFDRTVDATGAPIMDISHEGARWLSQDELARVLGIPPFDRALYPEPARSPRDEGR